MKAAAILTQEAHLEGLAEDLESLSEDFSSSSRGSQGRISVCDGGSQLLKSHKHPASGYITEWNPFPFWLCP